MITIKSAEELNRMRASAEIAAEAMRRAVQAVGVGVTTGEIDQIVNDTIVKAGATPSFKGYNGFPGAACVSMNAEIVHGIPSMQRVLQEGDIVSIDLGAYYKGYHSDMARTVGVGNISEEAEKLIAVTKESFFAGIAKATAGTRLVEVSRAIEAVAKEHGYGIIRELVGHGIGQNLHEAPDIPNYGGARKGPMIRAGMTFAIEPMFSLGSEHMVVAKDDWTALTQDGSLSAHYENTIAVMPEGPPEILTIPKGVDV